MVEVEFAQVQTHEQKEEAGLLIREYLDFLNQHLTRNYDMSFDCDAMVQSELTDPPPGYQGRRPWLVTAGSGSKASSSSGCACSLSIARLPPDRSFEHNSMESYQSRQQLASYYSITVFMELEL